MRCNRRWLWCTDADTVGFSTAAKACTGLKAEGTWEATYHITSTSHHIHCPFINVINYDNYRLLQGKLLCSHAQTLQSTLYNEPVRDGVTKYIFNAVTRVAPRVHAELCAVWYHQILQTICARPCQLFVICTPQQITCQIHSTLHASIITAVL